MNTIIGIVLIVLGIQLHAWIHKGLRVPPVERPPVLVTSPGLFVIIGFALMGGGAYLIFS